MKKKGCCLILLFVAITVFILVSCTEELHVHTFSSEWTYDNTYHWHEPTCGHDVVAGKNVHSWDGGVETTVATHFTDGVRLLTCTVCKATKTEVVPASADAHTYSEDWTTDETYHWHASTCGHDVVSSKKDSGVFLVVYQPSKRIAQSLYDRTSTKVTTTNTCHNYGFTFLA